MSFFPSFSALTHFVIPIQIKVGFPQPHVTDSASFCRPFLSSPSLYLFLSILIEREKIIAKQHGLWKTKSIENMGRHFLKNKYYKTANEIWGRGGG